MKTCETCKYRGNSINTNKNLYWCECGKTCVNGSAWESKAHPTEKGKVQWSRQEECPITPEQFEAIYADDTDEKGGD